MTTTIFNEHESLLRDLKSGNTKTLYSYGKKAINSSDSEAFSTFVASTNSEDRMGDLIQIEGWDTKAYESSPVVLWSHDSSQMPIGRSTRIWKDGGKLLTRIAWDMGDPRGAEAARKVKTGLLNSVSVGFRPLKWKERRSSSGQPAVEFLEQELLEISLVSVPANAEANVISRSISLHKNSKVSARSSYEEKVLDRLFSYALFSPFVNKAIIRLILEGRGFLNSGDVDNAMRAGKNISALLEFNRGGGDQSKYASWLVG